MKLVLLSRSSFWINSWTSLHHFVTTLSQKLQLFQYSKIYRIIKLSELLINIHIIVKHWYKWITQGLYYTDKINFKACLCSGQYLGIDADATHQHTKSHADMHTNSNHLSPFLLLLNIKQNKQNKNKKKKKRKKIIVEIQLL